MARPGYPAYRNILSALGCEVVELPCGPQTRYQPTVAMLEALDEPVKGLVLASPANPTGTVLDPAELRALALWCEGNGVQLISDEIYHGISYAGAPATVCAWEHSREAVVVNSFSKYFSMTGWRLGWLLLPPRLWRPADCLAGNFTVCPPALPQVAALAAFDPDSYAEVDGHVARYQVNRDLLLDGLTRLGITRLAPTDGAFYVYADVSHLTDDSMAMVYRLLAEVGLAVAPGWTSTPSRVTASSGCRARARRPRCGRPWSGWNAGLASEPELSVSRGRMHLDAPRTAADHDHAGLVELGRREERCSVTDSFVHLHVHTEYSMLDGARSAHCSTRSSGSKCLRSP